VEGEVIDMKARSILAALVIAGLILAAATVGGSRTIKILIYKDPGFEQDWSSTGPPGDYKTVSVQNPNAQDLTDFQVKLVFNPSSDSFFDSCQDGSALGIWTGDGSQQVPFWVETWTAAEAIIWFKAPLLAAGGTTHFRLYCSQNAAGTSDGDSTFVFFDDFEDGVWSDKWQAVGIPQYSPKVVTVVGPHGQQEKALMMCCDGAASDAWRGVKTQTTVPDHTVVELWRKAISSHPEAGCTECGGKLGLDIVGFIPNQYKARVAGFDARYGTMKLDYSYWPGYGWWKFHTLASGALPGGWWDWKVARFGMDGQHLTATFDSSTIETSSLPADYTGPVNLGIAIHAWSPPGVLVSHVLVRKFADQEPVASLE